MRILITGSKGKIGKILTNALSAKYDLFGLDISGENNDRFHKADISNYEQVKIVFEKNQPIDCVVHLAADPRIDAPWSTILKNNIVGTRNIYEAARRFKVKKVIFASSNHVTGAYEGNINTKMVNVNDPVRPDGYYGTSKVFGETIARQFFELYGIKSICLRIGDVLEDDDPTKNQRLMKIWLSHKDLVQLVEKSILSDINFGIYYGVSNNKGRFWDISNAEKEIGYKPEDDASSLVQ